MRGPMRGGRSLALHGGTTSKGFLQSHTPYLAFQSSQPAPPLPQSLWVLEMTGVVASPE